MRRRWTMVVVSLSMIGIGAPSAARADNRERLPIIALDLASDVAIVGSEQTFYLGLGGYLLGGPVVHAANGNWASAGGSLGMRVVGPILGGGIGCAIDGGSGSDGDTERTIPDCFVGFLVGIAVGMVSAQVLDAALLSSGSDATTPRTLTLGVSF